MAKKKPYKHIFFDLDRTLWDFETNSVNAMETVIEEFSLGEHIPGPQLLFEKYNKYNEYFWELYRRGEVTKQHLREKTFSGGRCGISLLFSVILWQRLWRRGC